MDVLVLSGDVKRQIFRLGTVLRYYVLQKQRGELDLREATRALRATEADVKKLLDEIVAVSALLHGKTLLQDKTSGPLSTAGWMACYVQAEELDRRLNKARARREAQIEVTARLEQKRKRWALAEETLL